MLRFYGRPRPARRIRKAVALEYDRERGGAPVVTAAGQGELAERIIEIARLNGVYPHWRSPRS